MRALRFDSETEGKEMECKKHEKKGFYSQRSTNKQ